MLLIGVTNTDMKSLAESILSSTQTGVYSEAGLRKNINDAIKKCIIANHSNVIKRFDYFVHNINCFCTQITYDNTLTDYEIKTRYVDLIKKELEKTYKGVNITYGHDDRFGIGAWFIHIPGVQKELQIKGDWLIPTDGCTIAIDNSTISTGKRALGIITHEKLKP